MSSDNFTETSTRTGFHLGLLAEIPLANKFSVQPEIVYSTQGIEAYEIMLVVSLRKADYKLNYIQVPVLAKIYLTGSLAVEVATGSESSTRELEFIYPNGVKLQMSSPDLALIARLVKLY